MKQIITIIFYIIVSTTSIKATPTNATKDDIKLLIHQMDKRFEAIQTQMDKRFEQVDKRFEEVYKRLDVNMYIMIAGFTIIMGYLLKERHSIKTEIQKEIEPQLIRKADKNILDKIIAIIEDMATKDKEIEALLKKHHLRLA